MELPRVSFAVAMVLLSSLSSRFTITEAFGKCTKIAEGSVSLARHCLPHYIDQIVIASRTKVPKGVIDLRITLVEPQKNVRFFCGPNSGYLNWEKTGKYANQIRVSYLKGVLHLTAYKCDDLSGPSEAGERCAIDAYSSACPGDRRSNHTCVYEVEKAFFSAEKTRNAVEIGAATSSLIRELSLSFKVSHSRTTLKTVSYQSRSYIIIPAGYRFCTFSDAVTVENPEAPTGFEWKCSLPKFLQSETTGACSNYSRCEKSICTTPEEFPALSRGVKSAPHSDQAFNLVLLMGVAVHIIVVSML